jgi:Tfp pilus assembly protein PilX
MKIPKYTNQSGLVSIMVASVLMVIMALITLGFTRLVQNEQRQAIDNQLSKQAFYAAESGINIAASSPGFPTRQEDCNLSNFGNGVISADDPDVTFTCILINPTPDDLVFGNDSITTNKSKIVPIKTDTPPDSITFQWKDYNNSKVENDCTANFDFDTTAEAWDKISPLKLDIYGIPEGNFNRDGLLSAQFGAILYPCSGATPTSVSYASASSDAVVGRIIRVNCQNPGEYPCELTITGVIPNQQEFYARFSAIYSEANVRITANNAANDRLVFYDAQAVVDSTGRANDVFQRLQARIPLYDNYNYPAGSVQTLNDVCKLYYVQENSIIDSCN